MPDQKQTVIVETTAGEVQVGWEVLSAAWRPLWNRVASIDRKDGWSKFLFAIGGTDGTHDDCEVIVRRPAPAPEGVEASRDLQSALVDLYALVRGDGSQVEAFAARAIAAFDRLPTEGVDALREALRVDIDGAAIPTTAEKVQGGDTLWLPEWWGWVVVREATPFDAAFKGVLLKFKAFDPRKRETVEGSHGLREGWPVLVWRGDAAPAVASSGAEGGCEACAKRDRLDRYAEAARERGEGEAFRALRAGEFDDSHCTCGDGEAEDDRGAVLACPVHGIGTPAAAGAEGGDRKVHVKHQCNHCRHITGTLVDLDALAADFTPAPSSEAPAGDADRAAIRAVEMLGAASIQATNDGRPETSRKLRDAELAMKRAFPAAMDAYDGEEVVRMVAETEPATSAEGEGEREADVQVDLAKIFERLNKPGGDCAGGPFGTGGHDA